MAIKYYPNRVYRAQAPAIDRVMAKRSPVSAMGSQNISATPLDVVVSSNDNWQLDSVEFAFSNNTASRNFTAAIMNGRKVVENLNDYLWFSTPGLPPQQIRLNPGFYTGTELATELNNQLDANPAYVAAGLTFTVTYDTATGLYVVTPSSGTIRYLDVNLAGSLPIRDSIAGHLIGLNVTTQFAANVTSDTAVMGLDTEIAFVNQTGNTDLSYLHTDMHTMIIDQAVHLTSNTGPAVTVSYVVVYENLV